MLAYSENGNIIMALCHTIINMHANQSTVWALTQLRVVFTRLLVSEGKKRISTCKS